MKFCQSALLALLVAAPAAAFAPSQQAFCPATLATAPRSSSTFQLFAANSGASTDVDISVPYDSAARLAYDQWRDQFAKGDFDDSRYGNFKANYEQITVANVVAKKVARDQGDTEAPDLLALNEFGDFSAEEYEQQAQGTVSTSGMLGQAMEAAQSQSDASEAIEDAFNALAEEEEVSCFYVIVVSCDRSSL